MNNLTGYIKQCIDEYIQTDKSLSLAVWITYVIAPDNQITIALKLVIAHRCTQVPSSAWTQRCSRSFGAAFGEKEVGVRNIPGVDQELRTQGASGIRFKKLRQSYLVKYKSARSQYLTMNRW